MYLIKNRLLENFILFPKMKLTLQFGKVFCREMTCIAQKSLSRQCNGVSKTFIKAKRLFQDFLCVLSCIIITIVCLFHNSFYVC